MSIFCKHQWEKVNEIKFKSEFEIISEQGRTPNTHSSLIRKVVTDYICTECGKLKRFKEYST